MKKVIILLAVFFIKFLNAQSLEDQLQTTVNNFNLMGLSVWVATNNQENTYHFGLRDFDRTLPINNDTKFRIASISKAVTALGLLKLYHQGAFELDEDISLALGYILKNPQFPNTPITYQMLLSHQSSLQDGSGYNNFLNATYNNNPIPNINELLLPGGTYYTPDMWRQENPGSYYAYSNINFGLIATLIEKLSGERFDIFMKNEILNPLQITGSYNLQDLTNINDLSVLYRFQGGTWVPQWDNYQGVMPPPPDLSNYEIGTNGVYFSPQGGLRISAQELGKFLSFLKGDFVDENIISQNTLNLMKTQVWDYNGNNGDNYFGLFNRWSLGLHHANINPGDQICNLGTYSTFIGHPGEAYGLVSNAYIAENESIKFSFLINGIRDGYASGAISSYYLVEEAIFNDLCNYFNNTLEVNTLKKENNITFFPNPAKDSITIKTVLQEPTSLQVISPNGKVLLTTTLYETETTINISSFQSGLYFLVFKSPQYSLLKKLIVE